MLSRLRFFSPYLSQGTQNIAKSARKFAPRSSNLTLVHKQMLTYDAYKLSTPTVQLDPGMFLVCSMYSYQ